jgi:hypothetical protein
LILALLDAVLEPVEKNVDGLEAACWDLELPVSHLVMGGSVMSHARV